MSRLPAIIAPSLLSADFGILGEESRRMLQLGADILHVDIMDGHFVPNLSFGMPAVKAVKKHTEKFEYEVYNNLTNAKETRKGGFMDCHLMVTNPRQWLPVLTDIGVHGFTFHYEACETAQEAVELLQDIRKAGMVAGLAIKPKTPIEVVTKEVADAADMILIMTVEPGFGGQKFMQDMMPKVRHLRENYPTMKIQVDGGIGLDTIDIVAEAGANVIVSGSGVFGAKDPQEAMNQMRAIVDKCVNKQ